MAHNALFGPTARQGHVEALLRVPLGAAGAQTPAVAHTDQPLKQLSNTRQGDNAAQASFAQLEAVVDDVLFKRASFRRQLGLFSVSSTSVMVFI